MVDIMLSVGDGEEIFLIGLGLRSRDRRAVDEVETERYKAEDARLKIPVMVRDNLSLQI